MGEADRDLEVGRSVILGCGAIEKIALQRDEKRTTTNKSESDRRNETPTMIHRKYTEQSTCRSMSTLTLHSLP